MQNIFIGLGRIVAVRFKSAEEMGGTSSLFDVTVSVDSGEPKKEGMQYAPSYLVNIPFWAKRADALAKFVVPGQLVFFKGHMVPSAYMSKDGEPKCQITIRDAEEFRLIGDRSSSNENSSSEEPSVSASIEKAKASKKQKEEDLFADDLDGIDFN